MMLGQSLVPVGPGFPALPRKLIERICSNEYVDFMELPPAKGRSRSLAQAAEGQIVVVQAADMTSSRRIIPDLATWLQCFGLYVAVLAPQQPHRVPELMAYLGIIAKASLKYKWPSWIVYDGSFRKEMAGTMEQSWARVDPSIYSLCFTGQALCTENWCSHCQCLDHTLQTCPARPKKRAWSAAFGGSQPRTTKGEICQKYNRFGGDCRFGKDCRFRHVCSSCDDPHPVSRCKAGGD